MLSIGREWQHGKRAASPADPVLSLCGRALPCRGWPVLFPPVHLVCRPDGSTFQVVQYSLANVTVTLKRTQQGFADNSTWTR